MLRFFLLGFLLFSQLVFGQSKNRKAQKLFEEAMPFIRYHDFKEAIERLDRAVSIDPSFHAAFVQLGDIYKKQNNFAEAKEKYRSALAAGETENFNIYYLLGETELLTADYQNAALHLNIFIDKATHINKKYLDQAKKFILDCNFALEALKNPVAYQPINLGEKVNSVDKDYFPALTADGQTLIFTKNINQNEDFYTSTKENDEWTQAVPLSKNINTENFNEGAQSLSPDGRYLFFTGCNRPDGYGRCDIYVCLKEGNEWSRPVNLGNVVNSSDWESQPSVSADGRTLYFLSNRPGGYGGYDIWKSTLSSERKWTQPVNLGPNINTPYDEATPFIHADGKTLYFSSEGWPGMGGKDIFYSKIQEDGTFSKAVNMGYPINTHKDELGLIVSANGQEVFFSANLENGHGEMDIYRFELPPALRPNPTTYVKGTLKDKDTHQTLEGNVSIFNLANGEIVYDEITDTDDGAFMAVMPMGGQYAFNISAEGYMLYSHHFDLNSKEAGKTYSFDIYLEKIDKGKKVKLSNIFFDTNKSELLPSSTAELHLLTTFIKANKNLAIEIQGHTDSIGNEKENMILSENRAKAVYDYLLQNGISQQQLSYKGFGETQSAASNSTTEGRQLNRRTEFVVSKYEEITK